MMICQASNQHMEVIQQIFSKFNELLKVISNQIQ